MCVHVIMLREHWKRNKFH